MTYAVRSLHLLTLYKMKFQTWFCTNVLVYKKILIALFLFPILLNAQPCASDFFLQQRLQEKPLLLEQRQQLEIFTQHWMAENAGRVTPRVVITIPIVIHIVWKNPEENLSDAQIQSQLEVLNRDFRAKNIEISGVPSVFKPAIADVELEFCLARRTPGGQATSGITRTQTQVDFIGTKFTQGKRAVCYTDLGGQDAWDTRQYLNVWVGKLDFGFLGEANFPGTAEPEEDGIRIDPRAFGTIGRDEPYQLGRTLTHEIGHYFNLSHLWGSMSDNPDCSKDDGVADTPRQPGTFKNQCPVHPQLLCGTASMFMNFMNYTNDACLAMFTKGQKERMLAALYGARAGLLTSSGCQLPTSTAEELFFSQRVQILGNPIGDQLQLQATADFKETLDIQLVNIQGQILFKDNWNTTTTYIKSVRNFSPGIYLLILKNDRINLYEKILISR